MKGFIGFFMLFSVVLAGEQEYKVALGSSTQLYCQIHDNRATWRRQDGKHLPSNSYLSIGDLVIDRVQRDAAGIYECFVPFGHYPVLITNLIVVELPKIVINPESPLTVRNGESISVHCNVTGDEPIQVEWQRANHQPFPQNVRVNENYLEFTHITPENAGRYFCSASNSIGNETRPVDVFVIENDEVLPPGPPEVREGDLVALWCTELTLAGTTFTWKHGNENILQETDDHLVLNNIRWEDAGQYICQEINPNGVVIEHSWDIRVARNTGRAIQRTAWSF